MENLPNRQWLRIATAIFLVLLGAVQTSLQFHFSETAEIASRVLLMMFCVCMIPLFKLREWALVIGAALLVLGLLNTQDGVQDLLFALDRAAFFAAFIYLVTLLKEAAQRSPSVLKLGIFLANQPPGRRYYSLAFGGHIIGILLNFGAISLLSPLVQRGSMVADDASKKAREIAKKLEQQQISALIRGFTWMVMWSPTSLAQVVLFTTVPGADIRITLPLGILATFVMIYIGRLEDRHRWRNTSTDAFGDSLSFPAKSAQRFGVICALLIGSTLLVAHVSNVSLVQALMLVAPLLVVAWFVEQSYEGRIMPAISSAKTMLGSMLVQSAYTQGHSAFTLGIAGFIGIAASKIAPVDVFSAYIEIMRIPEWLILICLPVIIILCGQIALSPIMVVVFLGSVLAQFQTPAADPNLVFFALGAGWALSMVASPNASATLLIAGITNIHPTTLTWRWNGAYAIICLLVFSVSFYGLSRIMG